MEILRIMAVAVYFCVGGVSLLMAARNLLSKKFLSFQEEAAGSRIEEIDVNLRHVILALMRVSGAGFLAVSILLIIFPAYEYFYRNAFIRYSVPSIAMIYCSCLCAANYSLHRRTGADTPWKKSLLAVMMIAAGIALSAFS